MCAQKKAAKLIEECEEIVDNATITDGRTISLGENKIISIKNCKPFVASSISFLAVSAILTRFFVYFYVKSKSNVLPY